MNTKAIVSITLACVMMVVIIIAVIIQRRKRRATSNQRINQSSQAQIYPLSHAGRNTPRVNENQIVTMSPVYEEEPPPSYDAFIAAERERK
jgi:hypothetical protein